MDYSAATGRILDDFERKPEGLELMIRYGGGGTRYDAMRASTALQAANFVGKGFIRPGQEAQRLSGWHSVLRDECSRQYRKLTSDPRGPQLSRESANNDPELQVLQAVRRGVRDAMRTRYKFARNYRERRRQAGYFT